MKDLSLFNNNYNELFKDLQLNHSKFQIHNFILGGDNGITEWGKYKQALRELHKRIRGMKIAINDINKSKIEIERTKRKIARLEKYRPEDYDLDIAVAKIDLENNMMSIAISSRSLREVSSEAKEFFSAVSYLKPKFTDITENERYDLDRHYWDTKFSTRIKWYIDNGRQVPDELIEVFNCKDLSIDNTLKCLGKNEKILH